MRNSLNLPRIAVLLALVASLSACVVAPPSARHYSSGPPAVYVETYPTTYYRGGYDNHHYRHDNRPRQQFYREPERREHYREERRPAPRASIPSPREVHREVRRSLGLPRLPGMP